MRTVALLVLLNFALWTSHAADSDKQAAPGEKNRRLAVQLAERSINSTKQSDPGAKAFICVRAADLYGLAHDSRYSEQLRECYIQSLSAEDEEFRRELQMGALSRLVAILPEEALRLSSADPSIQAWILSSRLQLMLRKHDWRNAIKVLQTFPRGEIFPYHAAL